MKATNATRRRNRTPDPLASRAAVKNLLQDLRASLPGIILPSDKDLVSLLRAAVYEFRQERQERQDQQDRARRRTRPSLWSLDQKESARRCLEKLLSVSRSSISPRSFIDHYLLIPTFPDDVCESLEKGEINLFEAEQLARLTQARTGLPSAKMKRARRRLLEAHLKIKEAGVRLKDRVDAQLHLYGIPGKDEPSPELRAAAQELEAELERDEVIGGIGPDHFFYEYLMIITSLMGAIDAKKIQDRRMGKIMRLSELLIFQLNAEHKQQDAPAEAAKMEPENDADLEEEIEKIEQEINQQLPAKVQMPGFEPAQPRKGPIVEKDEKGRWTYHFDE